MGNDQGLTVAITGVSGYVGGRLIHLLEKDARVSRILGFDIQPPGDPRSTKLIFDSVDVRNPALATRLTGVDVLIHLAFVMDPIKDEASMRDVNVNGTQNVFKSAGKAGVPKVVYTSSAVAYGAHPDNDVPLTEESPLRANLDFSYSAHKLECEYVVREFTDEYPETKVVTFRPAIVLGPHADSAWSHQLEAPVLFSVQGHKPPFQFVHEDDVAAALAFSVTADMNGPYNLAPRDWLEYDEISSIIGRRRVDIPEPVAFSMADRMWAMGLGEAPAGYLHYVMYPWVMSPDRLEAAGFKCEHSGYVSLMATLEVTRGRVRLGRAKVNTSDLKRAGLIGVAGIAAVGVFKGLRRRVA